MFGHEAPYELVVVSTTVFGTPPRARLHFGDAIVVDEDDSDDPRGDRAIQSLDTSCQSSVLGDSIFLPTIAGIDLDSGDDGPNGVCRDVDPGPADPMQGGSSLDTMTGAAAGDAPTEPRDETAMSNQEGPERSRGV